MDRYGEQDGTILERIGTGDHQAIASLYDRYSGAVYSTALRLLHDPVLAEQVLSDIFIEIWRSPASLVVVGDCLSPALAAMARNYSVALLRHKRAALPGAEIAGIPAHATADHAHLAQPNSAPAWPPRLNRPAVPAR